MHADIDDVDRNRMFPASLHVFDDWLQMLQISCGKFLKYIKYIIESVFLIESSKDYAILSSAIVRLFRAVDSVWVRDLSLWDI